jgi:hypothetical protein
VLEIKRIQKKHREEEEGRRENSGQNAGGWVLEKTRVE